VRFLVDECTGPSVAAWLRDQGYEVFSIFDEARGIDDESIIIKALKEKWIIITNDKDFGTKVYRDGRLHKGVILLRLEDDRYPNKIKVLSSLIEMYKEYLPGSFVVATEKRVRFAQK
jgi:predicted nuclease of predicted toxin-antitoxin system